MRLKGRLALTNFRITQYLLAMLLKGLTPLLCFSLAEAISGIKEEKVVIFAQRPGALLHSGASTMFLFWLRRYSLVLVTVQNFALSGCCFLIFVQ